jgi:hypothetical protein
MSRGARFAERFKVEGKLQARIRAGARVAFALAGLLGLGLSMHGCANVLSRFKARTTTSLNAGYVRPPIYIVTALISAANPTSQLDLVGENGEFGKYCAVPSSSTGTGAGSTSVDTPCKCRYRYTTAQGVQTVSEFNTTLVENDYVQCPNSLVTNNSTVSVSLRVAATNLNSNQVTVNLATSGTSLDFADPKSFQELKRFQCRKIASMPNPLDSGAETTNDGRNVCHGGTEKTYDPIQSDRADNNFAQNYYTNSVGASLRNWVNMSATSGTPEKYNDYECSFDPERPKYWADYNLFSVDPDPSSGSQRIFPGSYTDSVHRSTAFLAKAAVAPFTVPVHAYYAPFIKTFGQTSSNNLTSPIGYAATMDPTGQCPSSVVLPTGTRWVKLVRYKLEFSPRYIKLNATTTTSQDEVSTGIVCLSSSATREYAPDCNAQNTTTPPACHLSNAETPSNNCGGLAYRSIGSPGTGIENDPLCIKIKPLTVDAPFLSPPATPTPNIGPAGAGQAKNPTSTPPFLSHPNASFVPEGTDLWHRIGYEASTITALKRFRLHDPSVNAPFNTTIGQGIPMLIRGQGQLNDFYLDDCYQPKAEDIVYVVVPANVSSNNIPDAYRPWRLAPNAPESCRASPQDALSAACASYRMEYNLLPIIPNEEPGTTALFPACVIQPDPNWSGS